MSKKLHRRIVDIPLHPNDTFKSSSCLWLPIQILLIDTYIKLEIIAEMCIRDSSTEGCYSYTKEVKNGMCEISLGDEEKMALDIAMDMVIED